MNGKFVLVILKERKKLKKSQGNIEINVALMKAKFYSKRIDDTVIDFCLHMSTKST